MGERMQQNVRRMRKVPPRCAVFCLPCIETTLQLSNPRANTITTEPLVNGTFAELKKNSFALVLYRWHPGQIPRQFRAPDAHIEFAFGIRRGGFKPRESHRSEE